MKTLIFAILLFFILVTPARAQVVISEVYPAPTSDEKEWIELYNTSEESVDISGWKLFEHFSSRNELILFNLDNFENTNIEAKSFFVFELPSNKLNNSEEKISLENSDNEEVSSLHFSNSESQKSFSYLFLDQNIIGEVLEISNPTRGIINQIILINTPTPTPEPTETPTPTTTPISSPETALPLTSNTVSKTESIENTAVPKQIINKELEQYLATNKSLSLPTLKRIEKESLIKRLPQFSYIVQKNVSKQGVISAIIGGSLIIFIGFIL